MTVAATPEYVRFRPEPLPASRKTREWSVLSRRGYYLGRVKWNTGWRQYTLEPSGSSIWSPGCIVTVAEFCAERTAEHKVAA